ncbi:molybdopterin converting factor small subunit [Allocatelliglobosispora scoriae]|uniref:Molybdopterin converting factor small subunit n=1 Tax=Allocatelliglobosispora scoriae TaxID=643052 RepID=A0A841BU33_9ACTN|nr:MoaD/ThiS family protein [Allocatelliglobosispora scoriae]MBB5870946.1 molybdopterin converting factor small subunit [Allocatelliglobosispora scoriae]
MINVRYFAGARAAAGTSDATLPAGTSIESMTATAEGRLALVLKSSSFLVDGVAWHDRSAPLPVGCTLDVLPPFAGG